ncbi:histidine kinase [Alistipes sp.]|jgi:putative regulator of cell autolysis|uniref:histidine kinase n=2 Tax=Alistipes sp. TaxID=1872444 RepID=UPI003AB074FC
MSTEAMNIRSRYADAILNLLVAAAISLVVNFSYLLLLAVDQRYERPQGSPFGQSEEIAGTGTLAVSADGHGYVRYGDDAGVDSVYISASRVRRFELKDGDRLVVAATPPTLPGGHYALADIRERNGQRVEYSMVYNRPRESVELALQLLYYFLLSFILLTILTAGIDRRNASLRCFVRRCCWCLVAAAALYFVAPVHRWRTGQIIAHFMSEHSLDYVLLLRCSFAVVVSILYGRIFFLMLQRQAVEVENERLKTENLSTRYNMLVNQINPHFFFNSLNSLSMLVREREERKALVYIDQLSYTFRYILQNGQNTTSTLAEELRFAEAYGYLFKIRYADKLFFDVEIDRSLADRTLPSLTLQPLIDNAVKHNMITRSHPFRISIRTEGEQLVVSNPKIPRPERAPSTGIGLENLRSRWLLITGQPIEVVETDERFTVRLPLQKPAVPKPSQP